MSDLCTHLQQIDTGLQYLIASLLASSSQRCLSAWIVRSSCITSSYWTAVLRKVSAIWWYTRLKICIVIARRANLPKWISTASLSSTVWFDVIRFVQVRYRYSGKIIGMLFTPWSHSESSAGNKSVPLGSGVCSGRPGHPRYANLLAKVSEYLIAWTQGLEARPPFYNDNSPPHSSTLFYLDPGILLWKDCPCRIEG